MLRDVRSQKLRTSLTVFGIIWGTVAVTLLGAFGQGLHKQIVKNTAGLGDRIAIAWPSLTSVPFEGLGKGRRIRVMEEQIETVRREAVGVAAISSEYSDTLKLHYGSKTVAVDTSGVSPEFGPMRNLIPAEGGRFISPLDVQEQRRVLFLGDKIAEEIFGKTPAVGKTVLFGGSPFPDRGRAPEESAELQLQQPR
jgi:putative ABC transport system permease protein